MRYRCGCGGLCDSGHPCPMGIPIPEVDKEKRIAYLTVTREKLFALANEYALEGDGDTAVYLHNAANNIMRGLRTSYPNEFKE